MMSQSYFKNEGGHYIKKTV